MNERKCCFCNGGELKSNLNVKTVNAILHNLEAHKKKGCAVSLETGFNTPTHGVIDQIAYFTFKFCPECGKDLRSN